MSKLIVAGTLANLAATTGVSTHFGLRLQQEQEKNPKNLGWENLCVKKGEKDKLPTDIKDKVSESQDCYTYSGRIQFHEYNIIVELYNKFCRYDESFYENKENLKTFCKEKYSNTGND